MNAIQLDVHLLDVAVIHYQLLLSLAESLKLAGSSVIPNHESLLPYIAYLKEYTHTIVKHIQSRSAPGYSLTLSLALTLTHSLTHSYSLLLTYSLTHSLTH